MELKLKMGNISRKEREKRRLRREILFAASELFANLSYEKTTVQRIAEEAEVSVGTIYNLFSGKEEIFLDLINMIIENLDTEISEASDSNQDPVDKIRSFFRTYLSYCEKHLSAMIVIHHENPLKMKGAIMDFFKKHISILEKHFSMAIESGALNWENPRLLAAITMGYIDSYAYMITQESSSVEKNELISLFNRTLLQAP
ncbi:MAG: TetR family transcriptional regulator [Candidatus Latescibacteria bacterium]|nr:TetR family transcriptional regulator [bacterium]MBD3423384.1 TetR family transcriptional regulator [Candidatus Latescibacterota bacterium]